MFLVRRTGGNLQPVGDEDGNEEVGRGAIA
jgi:hypothetical protein